MTTGRRGRTLAGEVYAQIRREILTGRLEPGRPLRLVALCERFGVSLSVVREALTRLAEQGLARSQPQLGFTVVPLDADDLEQLTTARVVVETWALRESIGRAGMEWETQVVATHHALAGTPAPDGDAASPASEAWAAVHARYHAALAGGCGNPRMLGFREELFDASEVYRRWSTPSALAADRDAAGEHRAIMEAALARDADRACALLAEHLRATTRLLLQPSLPAGRTRPAS